MKPKNNKDLINKPPMIDPYMLAFVEALVKSKVPHATIEEMSNHFLKTGKALAQKDQDVKNMIAGKSDSVLKVGFLLATSIVCQQIASQIVLEKPDHDKN